MDGANAPTFNFTEGWFRTSGLYDLPAKYQLRLMEAFIADKCRWTKDKVQKEAAKYRRWVEFAKIAEAELVNSDDLEGVIQLIESDAFQTEAQLRRKIADLNNEAQNRLYCGDAVHVLEELPDGCIDIVITDPPYGIDYHSNRSQYSDHITRQGIANDELQEALATFDAVCARLARKTKPDAHIYVFVGWQTEPQFRAIVEKHGFTVRNILIWDKGNHGAGDLRYAWANRYEMIIFATKGNRPLNKRMDDIIPVPKIPADKLVHPTQKPVDLILRLLDASARKADTVCDPFMGSGSTIIAVKRWGGLHYIGIEIDRSMFEKAKALIGGASQ